MQKIISTIKECMTGKTCCEETGADCNQGRACPVRAGTHKPAEAVHQIQEPTVNQQLTDERAALAATPAAEPFGYFKAEPFGWTDCGPDDEGAVALYEKPQALLATGGQAQARSKNGWTFEELEAQLAEATKADPENCRAVGEELLKVIHDNFAALKAIGWDGPVDSPVEVVADLLNLLDEAKAAAPQQADAVYVDRSHGNGG